MTLLIFGLTEINVFSKHGASSRAAAVAQARRGILALRLIWPDFPNDPLTGCVIFRRCNGGSPTAACKKGGNMKSIASVITAGAIVFSGGFANPTNAQEAHVIAEFKEAKWGPAPPMLPAGAQIAVLAGDPTKSAPYTVRLKFPANYPIPAHSHPTDENVVVVSGSLTFGMGDKLIKEAASNKTLNVGGYALMPANMNHFAYTTQETTIVLFGQGPVEFKYVNPADDPRSTKK
jgi:quercetin dioxygenase-like cupin family protein